MTEPADPLYSNLSGDPDMAELLSVFAAGVSASVRALEAHIAAGDWPAAGRIAHQLKGSGGGYGFPLITTHAATLEEAVHRDAPPAELLEAARSLIQTCRRVRVDRN